MKKRLSTDWKKEAWFGILFSAYIIIVGWYSAKLGEAIVPQSVIVWIKARCQPTSIEPTIRNLRFLTGLGFIALLLGFHGYLKKRFRLRRETHQSEQS
ncbi:hypothetical protein HNQ64_001031 [Prosthecobacter dejongeii]|uniref:Uncharacterized protein n=1 Tax=Prosthecobacter dejongeii TaxID=48465 RepID=A0A7W8DNZ8_9BACT|nr:hypothetical protein [Prosthecobacter dejongeii]